MPNINYIKGRRKEYKVCHKLREEGFEIVQRSAGSHSPIDVLAISKRSKTIMLIQCKADSITDSAKDKLEKDNDWLTGKFNVEFVVV